MTSEEPGSGGGDRHPEELRGLVTAALTGGAAWARLLEVAALGWASRDGTLDVVLDDLAARAAAGDDGATELVLEIVHRLGLARPAITSVILDSALVDDAAQATLVTVERRIGSFEGRARFRTWLHTVARNEALMAVRRRQDEPVEELPATAARFSSVVAGRLTIEALVDTLAEPYRETLRLQLYDNLDYHGIARRLGVPVGTVRSRLAKARDLLRAALAERP
ncbi:MAG TPA: sigma-70 family RNA polymerase sigma factor [Acidimicrobiales bacterium]|nr:sigma-70 family RNA polymerase sigma factor [Acidimicrobiales bacterium]